MISIFIHDDGAVCGEHHPLKLEPQDAPPMNLEDIASSTARAVKTISMHFIHERKLSQSEAEKFEALVATRVYEILGATLSSAEDES